MSGAHTPWAVIASPTDAEMYAVQGVYLVADKLPIEDAHLIASAPDLLAACVMALHALTGVDRLLHQNGFMQGVNCPAIPVVQAAIARARGEAA